MDTFKSMTELLLKLPSDGNYSFQIDNSHSSKVKLFAPHGGCIEPCTSRLVLDIAYDTYDYFIFHGNRKRDCFRTLHVTSSHYDEPRCQEMVKGAHVAVAIHGCDGEDSFIEVGGGNKPVVDDLFEYLGRFGYPTRFAPTNRRGEDEMNFVNLAKQKGVQLELSAGFRKILFADFPRTLQPIRSKLFPFVDAMRIWMQTIESSIKTRIENT